MTIKIYVAGTHIFSPSFLPTLKNSIVKEAKAAGITALVPGDNGLICSKDIYKANLELIKQSNGIIAEVDPFRGKIEPDSGTVFEVGYAKALNKTIVLVLEDKRTYLTKMRENDKGCYKDGKIWRDTEGDYIENFGHPLNLMLFHAADKIVTSMSEAFRYFRRVETSSKPVR